MKTGTLLSAVLALILFGGAAPDVAAQSGQSSTGAVKDLLGSLWGRLRAATPRSSASAPATTVTAGLRGSEATESELRPYWRGDAETASMGERKELEAAQALADAGKFGEAAKAFEAFQKQNPKSVLSINAVFGAALAYAAMGDKTKAKAGFEDFVKRDPQHPLAKDAEQALAALR